MQAPKSTTCNADGVRNEGLITASFPPYALETVVCASSLGVTRYWMYLLTNFHTLFLIPVVIYGLISPLFCLVAFRNVALPVVRELVQQPNLWIVFGLTIINTAASTSGFGLVTALRVASLSISVFGFVVTDCLIQFYPAHIAIIAILFFACLVLRLEFQFNRVASDQLIVNVTLPPPGLKF